MLFCSQTKIIGQLSEYRYDPECVEYGSGTLSFPPPAPEQIMHTPVVVTGKYRYKKYDLNLWVWLYSGRLRGPVGGADLPMLLHKLESLQQPENATADSLIDCFR